MNTSREAVVVAKNGRLVAIRFRINARARRIVLKIDETRREAVCVMPAARDLGDARAFAQSRADWLADRMAALPEPAPFAPGAHFPLRGAPCTIIADASRRAPALSPDGREVRVAPGPALAPALLRWLKREARRDLLEAVARCERGLEVKASAVSVKDTRTRWGSCSAAGRLSFSWRVVCAPPPVLFYLAAHECAHLREMNHSPAFWRLVERLDPDWRGGRAWLREHGAALHAVGA